MKHFLILTSLAASLVFTGCVTESQLAGMEGRGKTTVFDAPYDSVWRAAVDAAQAGDLNVKIADKASGYIGASRSLQMATMGENVGLWVKSVSPNQTQVEVVSKQAGLPMIWFKNWEKQILNGVAANLTRESHHGERMEDSAGGTPYDTTPRDDRYIVPVPESQRPQ